MIACIILTNQLFLSSRNLAQL